MTQIDFLMLDWIAGHLRCAFLDAAMPLITALGEWGIIWVILAAGLLISPKTRRVGVYMVLALAVDVVLCNLVLKPLVARPRPFALRPETVLLIAPPSEFSFPSGHTAASFAAVGALFFGKNRLWIPGLVLASLIGFSRLYLYVHFPSDVVCGAALGIFCGWIGAILGKKCMENSKNLQK